MIPEETVGGNRYKLTRDGKDPGQRVIQLIRRELAWWGIDVSDLSDEELAAAICEFAERFSRIGFTAAEAVEAAKAESLGGSRSEQTTTVWTRAWIRSKPTFAKYGQRNASCCGAGTRGKRWLN